MNCSCVLCNCCMHIQTHARHTAHSFAPLTIDLQSPSPSDLLATTPHSNARMPHIHSHVLILMQAYLYSLLCAPVYGGYTILLSSALFSFLHSSHCHTSSSMLFSSPKGSSERKFRALFFLVQVSYTFLSLS